MPARRGQVRVLVDSAAGLPEHLAEELGITVLNLHLLHDEHTSSTSGLSALELAAAYGREMERGGDRGLVALHLSKQLSSTLAAAQTAAAVFDGLVEVIDTDSAGMAVGAAAMAAARLAADGADLAECAAMARDTLQRSETWLYLHRIEEIKRSGRITAATALVSTTLATKPIMRLEGGKLELAVKTRTQSKAFAKLVALVAQRAGGRAAFIAIQHHEATEAAHALQGQLQAALPAGSTVMVTDLSDAIAIHCGSGAIAVSAVFSEHMATGESEAGRTL